MFEWRDASESAFRHSHSRAFRRSHSRAERGGVVVSSQQLSSRQTRPNNKPGGGGDGYLQCGEHQGRVAIGQGELGAAGRLPNAVAPHLGQLGGQGDECPVAGLQQVGQFGSAAAQVFLLRSQGARLGCQLGHLVLQGLDLGLRATKRHEQENQLITDGGNMQLRCTVLLVLACTPRDGAS